MKTYQVTYFEVSSRQWTREIKAEDREDAMFKMSQLIDGEPCDGEVNLIEDDWRIIPLNGADWQMFFKFNIGDKVRVKIEGEEPLVGIIVTPLSKRFYLVIGDETNRKVEAHEDELSLIKRHRMSEAQKEEMEFLWDEFSSTDY